MTEKVKYMTLAQLNNKELDEYDVPLSNGCAFGCVEIDIDQFEKIRMANLEDNVGFNMALVKASVVKPALDDAAIAKFRKTGGVLLFKELTDGITKKLGFNTKIEEVKKK